VIELPLAAVAPVILPRGTTAVVQLYAVPEILLVNTIEVLAPEQIVCEAGAAVATGFGLTVITTVFTAPEQLLAVGKIV
jgi:hypothetical protein